MNKKKVFAVIALLAICTMGFAQLISVTTSCGKKFVFNYTSGTTQEIIDYVLEVDGLLCGNN